MNESEACHGGYLEKRQGVRSTKKLWFQLNGRELNYYKSNPAREPQSPKGSINLDGVQTVKRTSTQTHHFVQITTAKDTLRLKAESASACDEWVSKLHDANAATIHRIPKPP
ncbi:pleckstrin homology domain-containing family H member 2-like [Saccoglossus kowalevskii]|uniref:Pleckstrin homology domain-containing family H member 1-like n=1 Tax=Saccoglossus kowalevskii TaxID=10224 RepID=A0ABM0MGP7_SACKO|nr:PREDICTED: pleckstrin homology domain-containing family H member 1-like [Saccoglossus kowalevskii]